MTFLPLPSVAGPKDPSVQTKQSKSTNNSSSLLHSTMQTKSGARLMQTTLFYEKVRQQQRQRQMEMEAEEQRRVRLQACNNVPTRIIQFWSCGANNGSTTAVEDDVSSLSGLDVVEKEIKRLQEAKLEAQRALERSDWELHLWELQKQQQRQHEEQQHMKVLDHHPPYPSTNNGMALERQHPTQRPSPRQFHAPPSATLQQQQQQSTHMALQRVPTQTSQAPTTASKRLFELERKIVQQQSQSHNHGLLSHSMSHNTYNNNNNSISYNTYNNHSTSSKVMLLPPPRPEGHPHLTTITAEASGMYPNLPPSLTANSTLLPSPYHSNNNTAGNNNSNNVTPSHVSLYSGSSAIVGTTAGTIVVQDEQTSSWLTPPVWSPNQHQLLQHQQQLFKELRRPMEESVELLKAPSLEKILSDQELAGISVLVADNDEAIELKVDATIVEGDDEEDEEDEEKLEEVQEGISDELTGSDGRLTAEDTGRNITIERTLEDEDAPNRDEPEVPATNAVEASNQPNVPTLPTKNITPSLHTTKESSLPEGRPSKHYSHLAPLADLDSGTIEESLASRIVQPTDNDSLASPREVVKDDHNNIFEKYDNEPELLMVRGAGEIELKITVLCENDKLPPPSPIVMVNDKEVIEQPKEFTTTVVCEDNHSPPPSPRDVSVIQTIEKRVEHTAVETILPGGESTREELVEPRLDMTAKNAGVNTTAYDDIPTVQGFSFHSLLSASKILPGEPVLSPRYIGEPTTSNNTNHKATVNDVRKVQQASAADNSQKSRQNKILKEQAGTNQAVHNVQGREIPLGSRSDTHVSAQSNVEPTTAESGATRHDNTPENSVHGSSLKARKGPSLSIQPIFTCGTYDQMVVPTPVMVEERDEAIRALEGVETSYDDAVRDPPPTLRPADNDRFEAKTLQLPTPSSKHSGAPPAASVKRERLIPEKLHSPRSRNSTKPITSPSANSTLTPVSKQLSEVSKASTKTLASAAHNSAVSSSKRSDKLERQSREQNSTKKKPMNPKEREFNKLKSLLDRIDYHQHQLHHSSGGGAAAVVLDYGSSTPVSPDAVTGLVVAFGAPKSHSGARTRNDPPPRPGSDGVADPPSTSERSESISSKERQRRKVDRLEQLRKLTDAKSPSSRNTRESTSRTNSGRPQSPPPTGLSPSWLEAHPQQSPPRMRRDWQRRMFPLEPSTPATPRRRRQNDRYENDGPRDASPMKLRPSKHHPLATAPTDNDEDDWDLLMQVRAAVGGKEAQPIFASESDRQVLWPPRSSSTPAE